MSFLQIENLNLSIYGIDILKDVSLSAAKGEIVGIIGESGSGKSMTAYSVMNLVPTGAEINGTITLDGQDLLAKTEAEMCAIRGNDIGMIFQEPMTALNPVKTIGDQVAETVLIHGNSTRREAALIARDTLNRVGLPADQFPLNRYPHELSGGMKQRVMIAMAIVCRPALLIADEPTTALDVTIQAQILDLLDQLRKETQMAILLITHNLGIVAQYADRVAVMYSGKVVESAPVEELFFSPAHPYTCGLLNSLPKDSPSTKLETIPGSVPHPAYLPEGCAFHPRCAEKLDKCLKMIPPLESLDSGNPHQTACWLHERLPTE